MTRDSSNLVRWRLAQIAVITAMVMAAFFIGRYSKPVAPPTAPEPVGLAPETTPPEKHWLDVSPVPTITMDRPVISHRVPVKRIRNEASDRIEAGLKASELEHHRRFKGQLLGPDSRFDIDPRYGPDDLLRPLAEPPTAD